MLPLNFGDKVKINWGMARYGVIISLNEDEGITINTEDDGVYYFSWEDVSAGAVSLM